jgi:trigger factor
MDIKLDTLGPCRKKVAVTIPPERVRAEYDKQYGEINRQVAIPGFRKGHTPRKLLERRFARHLGDDVKEALVRQALETLTREKQVEPLQPPHIDLAKLEVDPARALSFEFELMTRPEFATPAWKGLEMKVAPVAVSEAEIDAGIDGLRRRESRLEPAGDGAVVAADDVLVVDWTAKVGDAVVAEDQGAYFPLNRGMLGGFPAAELVTQLLGKQPGAAAAARVDALPDDPREAVKGKQVELAVTLKEVRRFVLPALDAEWLKRHDFDDVAELRADARRQLLRGKTRERDAEAEERLVEQVIAAAKIELPDEILLAEVDGWAERRRAELAEEGVAEGEIDGRVAGERPQARRELEGELKRFFVLDRIAREEGIAVGEQELGQALQEIAQSYGRPIEEVVEAFRQGGRLEEMRGRIRQRKVREAIRRAAQTIETQA